MSILAIQNFQQRLFAWYKNSLSLPPTYRYIHGNPVQPLVPVDTHQGEVYIIAPSPPARLGTVGLERDVPVGDHYAPFARLPYFDGNRVRGDVALETAYLKPLGLHRNQCWLTYLVRVFLFRDEHLAKYRRLGCLWPEWETHSQFERLARQGLAWLEEELNLARPRLIITLGRQVATLLQEEYIPNELMIQELRLNDKRYPALHLPFPPDQKGLPSLQQIEQFSATEKPFRRLAG